MPLEPQVTEEPFLSVSGETKGTEVGVIFRADDDGKYYFEIGEPPEEGNAWHLDADDLRAAAARIEHLTRWGR